MISPQCPFQFVERSRRPPRNEVNAVLSFMYTLQTRDIQAALETVGLDPAAGWLHTLRPGRPSLALDLLEEFRAPLCDRLALSRSVKEFLDQAKTGSVTAVNTKKSVIKVLFVTAVV